MNSPRFVNVKVNGSHAVLCNGQGVAVYRLSGMNQILFTILKSKGCGENEMNVLNALDQANFFRIRDNQVLYLYDYQVNQVLTANFNGPIRLEAPLIFGGDPSNPQIQPPPTTLPTQQTQTPQVQSQTPQVQPSQTTTQPPQQPNQPSQPAQPSQPSKQSQPTKQSEPSQPPTQTPQQPSQPSQLSPPEKPASVPPTGSIPPVTPQGSNPNSTRPEAPLIITDTPLVLTNSTLPPPVLTAEDNVSVVNS
jgi:hypothetical protein